MKRIITTILTLCLLISSFCSCIQSVPQEERIELTKDNVGEYFTISEIIEDYSYDETKTSLMGLPFYDYEGEAVVKVLINKTSADFSCENVTITIKLKSLSKNRWLSDDDYHWAFKMGNKVDEYGDDYKYATLTIPYTGEYTHSEKLVLDFSTDMISEDISEPSFYAYIDEVSGYIIK